ADIIAFPEVFIPGNPLWIDAVPIWDGDEAWYARLVDQAVVVPSETTEAIAQAARESGSYIIVGIDERELTGATIFNTVLYFGPDGTLIGKHRKLVPTGSERTIWGMGDGSTLETFPTPFGRVGGLICWENYMPLARFFVYSQGIDIWFAPTLAGGDAWIATMQHIAREGRCYVVGINPCVHADQIPADFPDRDRLLRKGPGAEVDEWPDEGNSVIVAPSGELLAGPIRNREEILYAEIDLGDVHAARRLFDPTGHYHRPDVFRLGVDTGPRPIVTDFRTFDEPGRDVLK
ncbi:MAG: carbon-nitrogen hydrolase family protein, partial [Actinobacteria bacterium]|nr:carbon-nitrogen hydrolase family protein [Actinomycetota bacterium]